MSIVDSIYEKYKQANGSVLIIERHTDNVSQEYMQSWYAESDDDVMILSRVDQHASQLADQLAMAEIDQVLS